MAKLYERQVMHKFARVLEQQLRENFNKTNVGQSGDLERSLTTKVHLGADRRVSKISYSYLEYGIFVEMGVHNGTTLDDVGAQRIGRTLLGRKIGKRRAKRWQYKKLHGSAIRLADIVMTMRGNEYRIAIEEAIDAIGDVRLDV